MKLLHDTINESEILSELDDFDKSILSHIALYFYKNRVFYRYHLSLERYGVYEGLGELGTHIFQEVKRECQKQSDAFELRYNKADFKGISNLFFEHLIIGIGTTDDSGGEYDDSESKFSDEMLLENAYINIYSYEIKDVFPILCHEITHAYNHWKLMVKSSDGIADLCNQDSYSKFMSSEHIGDRTLLVRKVLSLTLKSDQNAFVEQMAGELKEKYGNEKKLKIYSPVEALNYIKNTDLYNAYKNLFNCVSQYDGGRIDDELAKEIKDEYNRISNTDFDSDKVFKKLKFLMNKLLKKFEKQIGKLCLSFFATPSSTMPSNIYIKS